MRLHQPTIDYEISERVMTDHRADQAREEVLDHRGVNAAMEAFWATLKRELAWIHQRRSWSSRAELRAALFDYIEAFYNRTRHQARLDHRTPAEVYTAASAA